MIETSTKGEHTMEILIFLVNWLTNGLFPDDICTVFSSCFIDWPHDSCDPWPCFFFADRGSGQ